MNGCFDNCNCLWIILLLICCGGCGCNSGYGSNSGCNCILPILIAMCCCGSGCSNDCGCNNCGCCK